MGITIDIPKENFKEWKEQIKQENLKTCKWCGELMVDKDDFCSPECLESYANEFLKKKE